MTTYHPNNKEIRPYNEVYNIIVNRMIEYMQQSNLDTFVLGISGGIDSTVVAALAHMACKRTNGKLKLIGISLPSHTNQECEVNTADLVLKAFCDKTATFSIQGMFDSMCSELATGPGLDSIPNAKETTGIAAGNIKARLRMVCLYHIAAMYKGLVLDTDNLSEYYLGFYTRSGDQFDYSPISGLWKTEVYELADYLRSCEDFTEEQQEAIMQSLSLLPTDGNGCTGKVSYDMDQIAPGYSYDDVDMILQALLDTDVDGTGLALGKQQRMEMTYEKLNDLDCIFLSFDEPEEEDSIIDYDWETVKRVCMRHFNTEFKRAGHPIRIDRSIYTHNIED